VLNPKLLPLQGKRISEIAAERKKDPVDTLLDIVLEDQAQTGAIYFIISEDDVRAAITRPWISLGLDSSAVRTEGPLSEARPHPRGFGSAARWLAHYVRDLKLMSLEEAVRKMTSLPAQRVGIKDRGLLKPVNGKLALDEGKFTGATAGKVLRGPGYRPSAASKIVRSEKQER